MSRILILVALLFPLMALAAPEDLNPTIWKGLTLKEQAEVMKIIAAGSEASAESETPSIEKVDEWVNVGERIGKMLNGAAKEVGMALTSFMATPAGKVALVLIVWKVAGTAAVHILGALVVWSIGAVVMSALHRNFVRTEVIYDPERKTIFGRPARTKVVSRQLTTDESWGLFGGSVVFTAAGLIVLFTM